MHVSNLQRHRLGPRCLYDCTLSPRCLAPARNGPIFPTRCAGWRGGGCCLRSSSPPGLCGSSSATVLRGSREARRGPDCLFPLSFSRHCSSRSRRSRWACGGWRGSSLPQGAVCAPVACTTFKVSARAARAPSADARSRSNATGERGLKPGSGSHGEPHPLNRKGRATKTAVLPSSL